jgi:RNA polymerase sigma-70 factor (ECF subfamily)
MSDTQIPRVGRAGAGQEQPAFEDFFVRTRDRVLRSALAASGGQHDVEDAVAEAYARALARWADVATHPAPEAWVMRTAINLLHDRHRSRERFIRAYPRLVTDEPREDPVMSIDPVVLAAIRRLPARQREVLALRVLMDLSAETTGQALGISTQSVGTHLHRALVALRCTFNSAGDTSTTDISQGRNEQ